MRFELSSGVAAFLKRFGPFVLLVAITFVIYGRAPGLPFIWDDTPLIVNNPMIQNAEGLGDLLVRDFFSRGAASGARVSEYFRPVATFSFWLDARFGAGASVVAHCVNVLLHICVVLLIFNLVERLGFTRRAAWVVALFFALNPVQTETVYWVSARAGILSMLWVLAATAVVVGTGRTAWRAFWSGVCLLLALLSKETAIGMLVFPVGVAWLSGADENPKKTLAVIVGAACAVGLYFVGRWRVGVFMPDNSGLNLGWALVVDWLTVVGQLLSWIAVPFSLSAAHDYQPWPMAYLLPTLLCTLCVSGYVVYRLCRGDKLPLVLWASVLATTVLMATAMRNIGVIGERYAYPEVFFVALLSAHILRSSSVFRRSSFFNGKGWALLAVAFTLVFGPVVWLRAESWHSEKQLFASALEVSGSSEAMRLLASEMAHKERNWPMAATLYQARVERRPEDDRSWNNLAGCLIELRRYDAALGAARTARRLNLSRYRAWYNEATALMLLGRPREALDLLDRYRRWRPVDPNHPMATGLPLDARYHELVAQAEELASKNR